MKKKPARFLPVLARVLTATAQQTKKLLPKSQKTGTCRSFHRSFGFYLCHLSLFFLVVTGLLGFKAHKWYAAEPWEEQIQKITNYQTTRSTKFYNAAGKLMSESYSAYRLPTSLEDIPTSLIDAVLAAEDKNFYSHRGLDPSAILRAALANLTAMKVTQGGSTITQQLVRFHLLSREKKLIRKIKEAILAYHLEKRLSKDQILEMYLNHLFLGQNSYGVASVSMRLFSRPLHKLRLHEHALIAGLFQAPSRYNPFKNKKLARKRQVMVLKAMLKTGKISKATFQSEVKKPLKYRFYGGQSMTSYHMYAVDYARAQAEKILGESNLRDKGYQIHTTLSSATTDVLARAIANMNPHFEKIERLNEKTLDGESIQAAGMVMNVRKGTIEAMIGGRNYGESHFNRSTQAMRSPGSLFKPIIYSYALMSGYKWSDTFYLAPITIADTYRPRSNEKDYLSETTLLRAFTSSINVTTVEVGKKLGLEKIINHAQKLGVRSPIKTEYGSLIGQSEVSQLDMVRMYSAFANQGKMIEPAIISHIIDPSGHEVYRTKELARRTSKVMSPEINFLMVKAMSSVLKHGTARSAAHLAHLAAGKTGTSNDSVDNWFCGFTSHYLTVVWVGPETSKPLHRGRGAGATLALPIWKETMEHLTSQSSPEPFTAPQGVRPYIIDTRYGHRTSRGFEAWFLAHHSPPAKPTYLKLINLPGKVLRGFGTRP